MKPWNGESYMESYTDAEHEAYWGDPTDDEEDFVEEDDEE